jgi:hypothetical protein
MQKSPLNSTRLSGTYVKAKTTEFLAFATGISQFYLKLSGQIIASSLLFVNICIYKSVKEANLGSDKAIKR